MAKDKNVWTQNFAEIPRVREMFKDHVLPMAQRVRQMREDVELKWLKYFNMWLVEKDDYHSYYGRAQLYIPEVRKDVEAQTRDLVSATFPDEDFFDCVPGAKGTKRGAMAWKSVMSHFIQQSKLPLKYHPFTRQRVMLGTSPAYVPWSAQSNKVFRNAWDPKTKKIKPTRQMLQLYQGPDFQPRPLFQWFAMNPKAYDFRDDGCFEDFTRTRFEIEQLDKQGKFYGLKELLELGTANVNLDQKLRRMTEIMEREGIRIGTAGYASSVDLTEETEETEANDKHRNFLCTRYFLKAHLPEAFDPEHDEDKDSLIPIMADVYFDQHVAIVRRNDFWHQQPPYVVGRYIPPVIDEFYGHGLVEAVQYMQLDMNSTYEQAMDSRTYALNPIAFIDPALAQQLNDFEVEPGAKWFVPPNAVKFGAFPDVSGVGIQSIQFTRSLMQDYSDRQPALPPQLLGKSRTATQANFVEAAVSGDLKLFIRQDEIEVLQPLMRDWEYLIDQKAPDELIVMMLGRDASEFQRTVVPKSMLLGDYLYYWKTTTFVQNKPVVARQMLDLFKITAMLPPQIQQQFGINYPEFIKSFWRLQNLPDGDKIVGPLSAEVQTTDPMVEHSMLDLGMPLEVLPGDDDASHLQAHGPEYEKEKDPQKKQFLGIHMLQHEAQKRQKQQAQLQQQQQQMMQMQMAQAQAQGGRQRSPGSGNRAQLSPNANGGDIASGVRP